MRQLPPQADAARLVRLAEGVHDGCVWAEPAYQPRGYAEALPEIWLRSEVFERLRRAAAALRGESLALVVWDGWRPLALQRQLWDEYRRSLAASSGLEGEALDARAREFVAPVTDDETPAHSTGGAVDLSLCTSHGTALDMGGDFDELTDRSHPDFYERPDLAPDEVKYRDRRRLLQHVMSDQGFERLASEWWHFEYGTPNWARRTGRQTLFGAIEGLPGD
ncbi:MAG TPA: M15 family metallopeptidase [Solirubrobacterales bacterium]|nr:M15 family metallopeptidase [Solirubrobacterales bacterium]